MMTDVQNRAFIEEINRYINFDGKRILEIGCGNGDLLKQIARYYSPKMIVGIDKGLDDWWGVEESSAENWSVKSGNAESLDFDNNNFDAVISISTFEHIKDIASTLSEIKRVLKPYGRFYASFSPIWTSIIGHHFIAPNDTTWNNEHLSLIPPWGHLYMSEDELVSHLNENTKDEGLIKQIADWAYRSEIINRIPKKELKRDILNCGMMVRYYSEMIQVSRFFTANQNELTIEIAKRVSDAGYDLNDCYVGGMRLCLEKLSSWQG